jgi:2-keto-4-pentenoate hydratase/2-oxohepta-3-ene-1,7-dioic acid hydratase in catechol pathway
VRFVTYSAPGSGAARAGLLVEDRVVDLAQAAEQLGLAPLPHDLVSLIASGAAAMNTAREIERRASGDESLGAAAASVRLRAPIPRPARNVVCVGLNYREHVAESRSVAGAAAPAYPVFFTKPPQTVIGPGDEIPWHGHVSEMVDWEAELAVIIGAECRDVDEASALEVVFGYTCANDVTARDLQGRHQQWYKGKGLDGYCPLGPAIVTPDETGDPQALDIALRVNGVEKQRSNTRHMIFPVARLIAEWSAGMTLLPGDVLLTGTPSGVGVGRTPPEFLRPSDRVEVEVERIGVLRNRVAGGS